LPAIKPVPVYDVSVVDNNIVLVIEESTGSTEGAAS